MKFFTKYILSLVLIIFIVSFFQETATSWGFFGHKKINRMAVFTLPPEMIKFYKKNIEYITEHAVDPDKRRYALEGEAPRHYIDIDHYVHAGGDPFAVVPKKWYDAVDKFTEDTLQAYGIVPWHVDRMVKRLTKAFETKDVDYILRVSADLGHYVGDSHVPLHTTENYNGQLTNQKGIHGFWESRLPELFNNDYDFFVGKAQYIADENSFIWDNILNAHSNLEDVLLLEKKLDKSYPKDQKYSYEARGETLVRTYSVDYAAAYHDLLEGMVEKQMQLSIKHIGDIWFTCWVNAGRPDLQDVKFEEVEIEEEKIKEGTVKSREHAKTGNDIFD